MNKRVVRARAKKLGYTFTIEETPRSLVPFFYVVRNTQRETVLSGGTHTEHSALTSINRFLDSASA